MAEHEKSSMMNKYSDYLKNWKEADTKDLNNEFKSGHSDRLFGKFHRRISREPEQVLRYETRNAPKSKTN